MVVKVMSRLCGLNYIFQSPRKILKYFGEYTNKNQDTFQFWINEQGPLASPIPARELCY